MKCVMTPQYLITFGMAAELDWQYSQQYFGITKNSN